MSSPSPPPGSWSAFLWVAAALCAGTMGTALISPLFPLYQQAWHFPASTITLIYVTYMAGVLAALLFLGRLPDHLGAPRVLWAGLVGVVAGLGVCAFAPGVAWLLAGRALIGVASGLVTTAGTSALIELEPAGPRRRGAQIASLTCVAGFGLGPLLGGLMAQFLPAPLVTGHLAVMVLVAALLVPLWRVRSRAPGTRPPLHPDFVLPAAPVRPAFAIAALAALLAFALFGLFAALAPSFIGEFVPWQGTAIGGLSIAVVLFVSGLTQLLLRNLGERRAMVAGLATLVVSVTLLGIALGSGSALLFAASDLIAGVGHGIAFMGAMAIVSRVSPAGGRAGILSSFFTVGYLGTIVPVLAVGFLADRVGIPLAVMVYCALFAVAALVLLQASRRVLAAV